jgi:hypothetical protein
LEHINASTLLKFKFQFLLPGWVPRLSLSSHTTGNRPFFGSFNYFWQTNTIKNRLLSVGMPYFRWLQAAKKRLISCSATTSWAPPDNRTHSSAAPFPLHRAARPTGQDLRQRSSARRMVLLRLAWVAFMPRATPQFQAESMLRLFRPVTFFSSPSRALFSCLPLPPHCELR